MPASENFSNSSLDYLKIGLQFMNIVTAVAGETLAQKNALIFVSDEQINLDQYSKATQWSDFRVVIPLLFNFYHGLEVILKGFLVSTDGSSRSTHKLSKLIEDFELAFPGMSIGIIARKYTEQSQMPKILKEFCDASNITIDQYYQALKYPESTSKIVYLHCLLKNKGVDGLAFFDEISKDSKRLVTETVSLWRQCILTRAETRDLIC
jgi:hypothetical protein